MTLRQPTPELIRGIRALLPFGLVAFSRPESGAQFGLVMQCAETELLGIKQQPPDCAQEHALDCLQGNSLLVTHSLAEYLAQGFSGLMLPCAYLRRKENARAEVGIAYFAYPSPMGHEVQEYPAEPAYDNQFGHGFTIMMTRLIQAVQKSSQITGITLQPTIGLDVTRRLQLGSLAFGFMLVGPNIICLKTKVTEADPTWTLLRSTGIQEVYHLPSVPLTIRREDLPMAKPFT